MLTIDLVEQEPVALKVFRGDTYNWLVVGAVSLSPLVLKPFTGGTVELYAENSAGQFMSKSVSSFQSVNGIADAGALIRFEQADTNKLSEPMSLRVRFIIGSDRITFINGTIQGF